MLGRLLSFVDGCMLRRQREYQRRRAADPAVHPFDHPRNALRPRAHGAHVIPTIARAPPARHRAVVVGHGEAEVGAGRGRARQHRGGIRQGGTREGGGAKDRSAGCAERDMQARAQTEQGSRK